MLVQVLKTIKKFTMFGAGDRVIVAVSGGPDSICMLYVLKELNMRLCINMAVACLDHGLRKNSSKEYMFVKAAAETFNLPFFGKSIKGKKLAGRGSLEEALRLARHDFLFSAAKKFKAKKIALAHHRDDQAETVLMRLLRGSGLYGMSAILPKREIGNFVVVRPLLEVSRKEILAYLKKERIAYMIDETNSEDRFFRNKIRNHLLPELERNYNPNIRELLSYFASLAASDYEYLSRKADEFLKRNLKKKKARYVLPLNQFRNLDISLRRLVLRKVIASLKGDLRLLTFRHLDEVEGLLSFKPEFSQVHLPAGVVVSKTGFSLEIYRR